MKKLALAIASLALAATPVFACPHEDKAESENNTPKTAEKQKQKEKSQDQAKTKEAAKPAKPAEKKTDKVSQK